MKAVDKFNAGGSGWRCKVRFPALEPGGLSCSEENDKFGALDLSIYILVCAQLPREQWKAVFIYRSWG
jgi:hypothetical protein